MTFISKFLRAGWRPALGWAVVAINFAVAIVAIMTRTQPDFGALSLLIGADTALVIPRTIEKIKGVA